MGKRRAKQEQPVRREVVLKIIELGMDTREVIARFEQERQALALQKFTRAFAAVGGRLMQGILSLAPSRIEKDDLTDWIAREGARVSTLLNGPNTLRVRLIGSAPTQGFLRLRVSETP